MILLDAAATTPVRRSALEAAWPYLTGVFGNPSSVHEPGLAAARALATARAGVAEFLGCRAAEVIFTSGGTEGANLAIKGLALGAVLESGRGRHVVTTRIEHEAVLESVGYLARVHGFAVSFVETDASGLVSAEALRSVLRSASAKGGAGTDSADGTGTALVTIGWANNEVGTVQDVALLASVAHEFGALFHTDAVQAVAALPVDVAELGVDALSFSGHKLGAPKGSGAVFVRAGLPLEPLLHGGGQERGRRSGTENVAWAVALAAACGEVRAGNGGRPFETRRSALLLRDRPLLGTGEAGDHFETRADASSSMIEVDGAGASSSMIEVDGADASSSTIGSEAMFGGVAGARLTGHPVARLPRHVSLVVPGVNGETVLLELERRGVIASAGSACAAGRTEPSHVLLALGYTPDEASTALRFTWTADVTPAELTEAATALADAVAAVRGA
jgi:cysteine desulfurase